MQNTNAANAAAEDWDISNGLGNEQVTFAKKPASTSSAGRVGVKDYPLAKHPDLVKTSSGKALGEPASTR